MWTNECNEHNWGKWYRDEKVDGHSWEKVTELQRKVDWKVKVDQ